MELLTPFDFVTMFPEDCTLAVIGNAPALKGRGLGPLIDTYDVVVRFNDCRIRGFEADVGKRTDILICNPYPESRPNRVVADEPLPRLVIALTPQTRRGQRCAFETWAGDSRVLFSYTPDIRIDTVPRQNISLTTGTYGLSLVKNLLRPRTVLVSGFTMFAPGTDFHYWSNTRPSGLNSHAPADEAHVFADLLNSFRCTVYFTTEIGDIFDRCEKTTAAHMQKIDWTL